MTLTTWIFGNNSSNYVDIKYKTAEDIEKAVADPEVLEKVNSYSSLNRVNVSEVMNSLSQVGKLLQLAYAGGKGFSCGKEIAEIVFDYQTLIKKSNLSCGFFVDKSIKALDLHDRALEIANKGKLTIALKLLNSCAAHAHEMAETSKELVTFSEELCNKAKKAAFQAHSEEASARQQKNNIVNTIHELAGKEQSLRTKTANMQVIIDEERHREVEALKVANKTEFKNMIFSAISVMGKSMADIGAAFLLVPRNIDDNNNDKVTPLTEIAASVQRILTEKFNCEQSLETAEIDLAKKQERLQNASEKEKNKLKEEIAGLQVIVRNKKETIKHQEEAWKESQEKLVSMSQTANDRAADAAKKRFELQHEQIKVNAELSESISKLQNLSVEDNNLQQAIASLEITIRTLGKIKTIFENTSIFWHGIKTHCEDLKNIENLTLFSDPDLQPEFIEGIKSSKLNWLVLGRVNVSASRAIQYVDKEVDGFLNHLPSKEEADQTVQPLIFSIKSQIRKESQILNSLLIGN